MKKLFLVAISVAFIAPAFAQKSEIRKAKNALADKDFTTAQKAIDAVVTNPETENDPQAWDVRSLVYLAMQQQPGNAEAKYYQEANKSLQKVVALKPTYEKSSIDKKLIAVAQYSFNDGIRAYQKQDFNAAVGFFNAVGEIHNIEGGQRFANNKLFDTIAHQASAYQGYSAYYANRYDEALPLLQKAKNDPIVKDARNYLMIADIYESKKDNTNLLEIIKEGKEAYPKDQSIINREMNYYVATGQTNLLIGKLEDAIKNEPNNPDLLFNLATAYDNMANPKDNSGKELPKPANYNELFAKAETAYANTAAAAPNKPDVFYNYGALYFNRAVTVNEIMNKLGSSDADLKKYDVLKTERNEWFNKALPMFEKVISLWESQAKSLKGDDFMNYQSAIVAAKEIYAKQNNFQKATELKKKLEALK